MAPEAVSAPFLFLAQKHLHDSGDMEKIGTIAALAALAQETRLDIFRMPVQAGSEGRAVGHIGEKLGLNSTTLSFHLSQLKHAGLVTFRREGRSFDLHRQLCGDERADGLSHRELLRRRYQRLRDRHSGLRPGRPVSGKRRFQVENRPASQFQSAENSPDRGAELFPLPDATCRATACHLQPAANHLPLSET